MLEADLVARGILGVHSIIKANTAVQRAEGELPIAENSLQAAEASKAQSADRLQHAEAILKNTKTALTSPNSIFTERDLSRAQQAVKSAQGTYDMMVDSFVSAQEYLVFSKYVVQRERLTAVVNAYAHEVKRGRTLPADIPSDEEAALTLSGLSLSVIEKWGIPKHPVFHCATSTQSPDQKSELSCSPVDVLSSHVAVKICRLPCLEDGTLNPETPGATKYAQLANECRLLTGILATCPGMPRVKVYRTDKHLVMVQQPVGLTLANYSLPKDPWAIDALLCDWARQLVEILQEMHRCGVMHNDINPDNIIVDPATNRLVLIDLGCAGLTLDGPVLRGPVPSDDFESVALCLYSLKVGLHEWMINSTSGKKPSYATLCSSNPLVVYVHQLAFAKPPNAPQRDSSSSELTLTACRSCGHAYSCSLSASTFMPLPLNVDTETGPLISYQQEFNTDTKHTPNVERTHLAPHDSSSAKHELRSSDFSVSLKSVDPYFFNKPSTQTRSRCFWRVGGAVTVAAAGAAAMWWWNKNALK
eukprot:gb/GEZN01004495.1/.p1 GENE.gb/GEZN01004495.1/~~gb/GEZN01004495.1/.p1  ORF type:complete len:531 (-),score=33.69 gb/GEZN01004495.1/:177-1769(-)